MIVELKITQMIKHFGSASRPWLVRCNNDSNELYIVKFSNEDNSFVNEHVCYSIANKIGLSTTPSFASYIEKDQVEIINQRKKQVNEPLIKPGNYFFSKYVKDPYTLEKDTHTSLQNSDIQNLDQVPGMIAFDIFVENRDRKAQNALIHPIDDNSAIFEYILIDHGHCIGGPRWNAKSLSNIQYSLKKIPWKITEIHGEGDFISYIAKLKSLDSSFFKSVLDDIPEDWKLAKNDHAALLSFLTNRDSGMIFEAIKIANNNTHIFPNWK